MFANIVLARAAAVEQSLHRRADLARPERGDRKVECIAFCHGWPRGGKEDVEEEQKTCGKKSDGGSHA